MKKWQKSLILVLAFAVAILGSAIVTMQLTYREQTPAEAKTAEIGAYLDRFFIDDYDEEKLADAAASAMVEATGDRWSYYLTAEEKSSYDEQMQNAYVGIGVTITAQEELGGMRIEAVTAGGPAEEAGLLTGDIITEVEGEKTLDLGMTGTRAKVRGEEGTFVTLTILRGEESFPVSVERRSIQTPVATYEMLDGQIGYIKIANFDTRCAEETNAAMDELIAQGAKALIFDVRNNGGGYKNELVKVLDKILPEGILFQSEDYQGSKQIDRSEADCIDLPMAVLVNQDSYSAAEFFAAAIQEYDWGTVVGTKTVGKGNFQTAFTLSDGSMLNLSIGKYYTPQGRSLTDTGITPDVEIALSDEDGAKLYYGQLEKADDAQLQAAIREITQKLS
ncbi:MAG TPA: S41 family peptidase [Clostridiales bacterium]|nr:S41 family peptidase [Clostridiales bacterium]